MARLNKFHKKIKLLSKNRLLEKAAGNRGSPGWTMLEPVLVLKLTKNQPYKLISCPK